MTCVLAGLVRVVDRFGQALVLPPRIQTEHREQVSVVWNVRVGDELVLVQPCPQCNGNPQVHPAAQCAECWDWGSPQGPTGFVRAGRVKVIEALPVTDDMVDDCPGVPHLLVMPEDAADPFRVYGCGTSTAGPFDDVLEGIVPGGCVLRLEDVDCETCFSIGELPTHTIGLDDGKLYVNGTYPCPDCRGPVGVVFSADSPIGTLTNTGDN